MPYIIETATGFPEHYYPQEVLEVNIRNHCANLYSEVSSDDIFYSLQRGVSILSEENQLLAYMNSYGNMHYAKLKSAFLDLEPIVNQNKYELFISIIQFKK